MSASKVFTSSCLAARLVLLLLHSDFDPKSSSAKREDDALAPVPDSSEKREDLPWPNPVPEESSGDVPNKDMGDVVACGR